MEPNFKIEGKNDGDDKRNLLFSPEKEKNMD